MLYFLQYNQNQQVNIELYSWEIITFVQYLSYFIQKLAFFPSPYSGHQHGNHTKYAQRHKVISNLQNIIWFRQRCLLKKYKSLKTFSIRSNNVLIITSPVTKKHHYSS